MTTVPHEPSPVVREQPSWALQIRVPEMWASLAIVVIWLSVLVDAIFGPAIVSNSYLGDHTTVPSAVVVALFAFLATWVVAKYGFRQERRSD
jgi:hypothetical protein